MAPRSPVAQDARSLRSLPSELHSSAAGAWAWADVLVDGAAVGQTPLGTLNQSFGTHQIEFSHPAFGTHRRTVVLSQREVTRVSVDMRVP